MISTLTKLFFRMTERLTDEQLRLLIRISPDEYEVEAATEILALRARVAKLEAALTDAIECTERWAAYASDYFSKKTSRLRDIIR